MRREKILSQNQFKEIGKQIMNLSTGAIDLVPVKELQFDELNQLYTQDKAKFYANAVCVGLGLYRTNIFAYADILMIQEFSTSIASVMQDATRTLPYENITKLEDFIKNQYPESRKKVMKLLEENAASANEAKEAFAIFDLIFIDSWCRILPPYSLNFQTEKVRDQKGFYPRETVLLSVCNGLIARLEHARQVIHDSRALQSIYGLLTEVAESCDRVDILALACTESLKLSNGKVLETTPVGITESYAYALQLKGDLEQALVYYEKALDGIKTSVQRNKADAIVLQACLVQGKFDKEKALKLAFSYSPYFTPTQQFSMVGPARSLLVQQCEFWAKDLGYQTLEEAQEKLTSVE